MQLLADFFTDSLVWPAYIYFSAYGVAWGIACLLARLFMKQDGIDRAATRAWMIAIIMHLLGGTILTIWIGIRADERLEGSEESWHLIFYLIFYVIILIIDVCFLFNLFLQTRGSNSKKAAASKSTRQSLNPKKQ